MHSYYPENMQYNEITETASDRKRQKIQEDMDCFQVHVLDSLNEALNAYTQYVSRVKMVDLANSIRMAIGDALSRDDGTDAYGNDIGYHGWKWQS